MNKRIVRIIFDPLRQIFDTFYAKKSSRHKFAENCCNIGKLLIEETVLFDNTLILLMVLLLLLLLLLLFIMADMVCPELLFDKVVGKRTLVVAKGLPAFIAATTLMDGKLD